jgi:putative transposase
MKAIFKKCIKMLCMSTNVDISTIIEGEAGMGLITPIQVHYSDTKNILRKRAEILKQAFQHHPESFVKEMPEPPACPTDVWINPPRNSHDKDA